MIGEKISHYLIQEHLGSGGMAVVYRAVDQRLGRPVALKFLPKELKKQTEARNLLLREAQAASGLDHPNICAIYQIDETAEGALYIAMAYYEGETLEHRLKSRGAMPLPEAMSYASQIAAGLGEAHRHGIVHCDVKPANVFLTREGKVKILDFGIARLGKAGESAGRSKWIMGTVPYMSPEQIRGEELDARSDIWSLGVVLYQMVAGQRPFRGATQDDTKRSILRADPLPIEGYAETDLAGLHHILRWSLSKRREDRYNNAREMQGDLVAPRGSMPRGPSLLIESTGGAELPTYAHVRLEPKGLSTTTTGSTGPHRVQPSIAVLLPVDGSRDHDQQHLCFGIAEELISRLAKIAGLKVAARTSAFSPALGGLDPGEIGRRLQVATVLESSVRKFGDRLRISARLIEVETGGILWTDDFDRDTDDLFAVQDEIADSIADRLRLALLGDGNAAGPGAAAGDAAKAASFEAYDLYLKGRFCWNKRSEDELRKGIEFFQKAIAEHPEFPQAYAGLADSYAMLGIYGSEPPAEVMPRAKTAAQRALELDASLAEVYTSRGVVRSAYEWDFAAAAIDFQRASQLDPGYATAHQWLAMHCLIPRRRYEQALDELQKAVDLDPMSLPINCSLGLYYYYANEPDKSVQELRRVLEIEPDFAQAQIFLSQALREQGDAGGAMTSALRAAELTGGKPYATAALALAHGALGEKKRVGWLLEKLLDLRGRFVPPTLLAQLYLGLGEIELAFNALDRAFRMRTCDLIWLGCDPVYAPLRPYPRFQSLLRELGLERN